MNVRGAGIALAFLLTAAAPASTPVLRAQEWTERTPALASMLNHAQGECLAQSGAAIEVGRALFRAPVLFGGPGARVGLSCEACHSGGTSNPHFHMDELSDAPGTVDVTSEWASKVRGDGIRNPVPIPDLVGVGQKATFGGAREPSLEVFVRGVIVEEFQGPLPTPAALEGLLAYLRAFDADACPATALAVTLDTAADDVRRAVEAASGRATDGDNVTASLLLYAAQDGVARIVERLPAETFRRERAMLTQLSRDLGGLRDGDVATKLADARGGWMARFDATVGKIQRREARTYFNPAVLERALFPPAPR